MLVLPNMDPSLHNATRSASLPRALIRNIAHATTRLSVLLLKIIGIAIAMLLLPQTIQVGVRCLDNMYEAMGRRARSPWEPQALWGNGLMAGLAIMFVLHDLLRQLSYNVILDEDVEDEQARVMEVERKTRKGPKITWERVLMRMIIPVLLFAGLYLMILRASGLKSHTRKFVEANTVDLADDANARLVWRDR